MIYAKIGQCRKQLFLLTSHNQMLLEGHLVSKEIRQKVAAFNYCNALAPATKMSGAYVKSGLFCIIPNDG